MPPKFSCPRTSLCTESGRKRLIHPFSHYASSCSHRHQVLPCSAIDFRHIDERHSGRPRSDQYFNHHWSSSTTSSMRYDTCTMTTHLIN